jgi:ribosome maturation protein Sdo1
VERKDEHGSTDEIEITPEMIEAGLEQLSLYSPREDSSEFAAEIVEAIFRKMLARRRKK